MNNSELKTEVNELIDTLVTDGDRRALFDLIKDLTSLKELAEDRLAELGGLDDSEDTDDIFESPIAIVEIDDGEDFGDDLGDGVEDD